MILQIAIDDVLSTAEIIGNADNYLKMVIVEKLSSGPLALEKALTLYRKERKLVAQAQEEHQIIVYRFNLSNRVL